MIGDEIKDWYYSRQITENTTINAQEIASELNISAIDMQKCRVWLETTGDDGMLYVANAEKKDVEDIELVEITDIDIPTANKLLDTLAVCTTTGVNSRNMDITWTPSVTTAGYNTSYTATVRVKPDEGYRFAETGSCRVTVNGGVADNIVYNEDKTISVSYTFFETEKDKLIEIVAPKPIVADHKTTYDKMNLPSRVAIKTEGNTRTEAAVSWEMSSPESGSYDLDVLEEQTVTLKGIVSCPDDIDSNGIPLYTSVTITVKAADITGKPSADIMAGNYVNNQSVKLTSSTDGAKIYYTTDGSEPQLINGVLQGTTKEFVSPIFISGIKGEHIVTTIKAFAVKDGLRKSSTETFEYTISIPKPKYTIVATAGVNGRISPTGTVEVTEGESRTYTISAEEGYEIDVIKVDGESIDVVEDYTFDNVVASHTIDVTFKQKKPAVVKHPQNVTVESGNKAVFSVLADGVDITYRWQIDRNDGNGFVDIPDADGASYTISQADISNSGYSLWCIITNQGGMATSNIAKLTVTPIDYDIVVGADSSWELKSDAVLAIGGNGERSRFLGVKIDDAMVSSDYFDISDSETLITMDNDYLNTFTAGKHTFEILWTDSSAATSFTVTAQIVDNEGAQTGDSNMTYIWIMLIVLSLCGIIGMIPATKRKNS